MPEEAGDRAADAAEVEDGDAGAKDIQRLRG